MNESIWKVQYIEIFEVGGTCNFLHFALCGLSISIIFLSSSFSFTSSKSEKQDDQGKAHWKNRHQQLFFFLGYCMNMKSLTSLIYEDRTSNPKMVPSLIQIILVAVIIAGPLLFIQIFIGQFTQKGCIAMGAMLPATYGFGYCMMVVGILDSVQTLYGSGAGLFYVATSLFNFPYPAWMYCTDEMYEKYPNCFSREDIDACQPCQNGLDQPCFEPNTKMLSATIFKYLVGFEKDIKIQKLEDIGLPQVKSVSHVFVTIVFVYFASCRRLLSLDWSLRLCLVISILGVTVSLVVIIANASALTALRNLFQVEILPLTELTCWLAAVRRVTDALKISSGGHVYLGSYLRMDTASHFRVTYLMGYYLLFVTLYFLHFYLTESMLRCRLNMESVGVQSGNDITFVLYATELGLSATPQLWSSLHFGIYWILSITSMTLQITLADETLGEELRISKYYKYTRFGFCAIIFLLTLPLTTKGGNLIAVVLGHELKNINLLVICLTFIILFLYNMQRLNDDIHFVLNAPPTWYIQTCWIIAALVCGTMFFFQMYQYLSNNKFYELRIIMYSLTGSPILIGFLVKFVGYVKKRNITGMFRPSVYYGAPDLNTRMLRLLYNPRLEVRYKRRKESCKHRCLLDNEIAVKAVENEIALLAQLTSDLKNNEIFKGEYSDVIAQLEEHNKIIKKRYADITERFDHKQKIYTTL